MKRLCWAMEEHAKTEVDDGVPIQVSPGPSVEYRRLHHRHHHPWYDQCEIPESDHDP